MFLSIAASVFCVFLMAAPGFAAGRRGIVAPQSVAEISAVHVNFIYPCLIFPSVFLNYDLGGLLRDWALPASSFLIMLTGCLAGLAMAPFLGFASNCERKSFLFQSTMNNYSFLPMPLVLALYGMKGVSALILSTLGAELAMWTIGVMILGGGGLDRRVLRRVVSPPLCAIYAAVLARLLCDEMGWTAAILDKSSTGFARQLLRAVETFGAATIPLAMVIAGARISWIKTHGFSNPRVWVLTFSRLVAIPLVAVLVLRMLPLGQEELGVMTIVAVMPVALASFVMSEIYGGDKDFISCSALSTHAFSLLTIPVLLAILL